VPDQYLGDVMGNVSSRRGRVDGTEVRGQDQIIHAFVPLSEMFGYDPPETSDEPFVYDPAVYRYPEKLKDAKEDP